MSHKSRPPRRSDPVPHPESIFFQAVNTEMATIMLDHLGVRGESGLFLHVGILPTPSANFSDLMIWKAVSEAFAFELYLKALAVLDKGSHLKPEHELKALFEDLNPATQQEIRDEFALFEKDNPSWKKGGMGRPDLDFDKALALSSDVFHRWRYVHEAKIIGGYFAHQIMICTRRVIVRRRKDWERRVSHIPATWYTAQGGRFGDIPQQLRGVRLPD